MRNYLWCTWNVTVINCENTKFPRKQINGNLKSDIKTNKWINEKITAK